MKKYNKIAFIFPGQGAQYPGMGKDFYEHYTQAKETVEEAEDILGRSLKKIIFDGPESELTETRNSQVAIFVISMAILRVLQKQFPDIQPSFCAGLSLGEYTALTASNRLSFKESLSLVSHRAEFMNEACETAKGTMAVVMGLSFEQVQSAVDSLNMPKDIWVANINCPGQIVISGTDRGIEAAIKACQEKGAKRVLPLQVHGAFHSGLMQQAEERLAPFIQSAQLKEGTSDLVMNVVGDIVRDASSIRHNLIKQVTMSVKWEQGIGSMIREGADCFIEIGCGKTLAGLNKRMGLAVPTISIETVENLSALEANNG